MRGQLRLVMRPSPSYASRALRAAIAVTVLVSLWAGQVTGQATCTTFLGELEYNLSPLRSYAQVGPLLPGTEPSFSNNDHDDYYSIVYYYKVIFFVIVLYSFVEFSANGRTHK